MKTKQLMFRKIYQDKDFEKGTYFVNVFDKGELVSKSVVLL
jgi:hypothetical protein